MWLPYTKYIEKLKQKKAENPYYRFANQQQKKLSQPWQEFSDNLKSKVNTGEMSDSALSDMILKQQSAFASMQRDIFNDADLKTQNRNDMIDNEIDQSELKNDFYKKQQEEIEKQKRKLKEENKKNWWQVGAEALGAGAGFLMAGPSGAMIGSGAGNLLSGIFNDRPQVFSQGIQDTLSGFSSLSVLSEEKQFYDQLSLLDYDALKPDDLALLASIINSGNDDLLLDYINKRKRKL